jgi:Fic family protein
MNGEMKKAVELFQNEKNEYENINYSYFSPNLLNNGFQISNPDIYLASEKTIKTIAELNADSKNLRNIEVFLNMIVRQEAVKSSSIEGTRTTFTDLFLPKDEIEDTRSKEDLKEVVNYIYATLEIGDLLNKLPISERFMCKLHEILLKNVRGADKKPGCVRRVQNWIGGESIRSAKFVPPHWQELPKLLDDLYKFWHNENIKLPTLVKMALFHYQFETIHPFEDGNGRIGRLLILAQLLETKQLSQPWFNVSYIFERNKDNYLSALKSANVNGDIENWILFFLDSLNSAAQNTYKIYHEFNELQKHCSERIISLGAKAQNAQLLLEELYKQPVLNITEIAKLLDITRTTAKRLADNLIFLDIVKPCERKSYGKKINRKQQGIYFEKYINLFE